MYSGKVAPNLKYNAHVYYDAASEAVYARLSSLLGDPPGSLQKTDSARYLSTVKHLNTVHYHIVNAGLHEAGVLSQYEVKVGSRLGQAIAAIPKRLYAAAVADAAKAAKRADSRPPLTIAL
jgi:hypothetical protein